METALITGGEGGLGKATASALETAGMKVLAPGRDALDVSNRSSINDFFRSAEDVDLLVCNAGCTHDVPLSRMAETDWDEVLETNLNGAFRCAREVARGMAKRRRGHIIFISSYSAQHPPIGQANYAAAKAALLGMTRSMAQELGSRNLRINAILPGFMQTKMTANLSEQAHASIAKKHALPELNTPEQAAQFISFLHHHLPHTSGQVFNLDSRIV